MAVAMELAGWGWLLAAAVMAMAWAAHLRVRNAGIADVGWAVALVALAVMYAIAGDGDLFRRWGMAAMVGIWGLRLASHLLGDRVIGRREDPRYTELRARDSWVARRAFWFFFQAQAVVAVVMSAPMLVAAFDAAPLGALEAGAAAVWLVALAGEVAADRQLVAFKRRHPGGGQTCREGLWRYSRHPNYFFEWLVWIAWALYSSGSPLGAAGFIAPAVLLYLLLRVTGIPATEAQAVRTRGDDYRRYQATTSAFVPWWPSRVS
jgi:steroid 5-alpha reductase family enzyme